MIIAWKKAESKEEAEKALEYVFVIWGIFGVGALIFTLFLGDPYMWIDFVITGVLAFWIYRNHSVAGAALLIAWCVLSALITFMQSRAAYAEVSPWVILPPIFLTFVALRVWQAAKWLKDSSVNIK